MRNLVAFPILLLGVLFQSAVLSQLRLVAGFADFILVWLAAWSLQEQVDSAPQWAAIGALFTGFVTHVPAIAVAAGYFSVVILAKLLSRRVWQAPILAMLAVTLLGTILVQAETYLVLRLTGTPLPLLGSLTAVTIPSLILNLLLAIPVFSWARDLAAWTYPEFAQA